MFSFLLKHIIREKLPTILFPDLHLNFRVTAVVTYTLFTHYTDQKRASQQQRAHNACLRFHVSFFFIALEKWNRKFCNSRSGSFISLQSLVSKETGVTNTQLPSLTPTL